MALVFAKDRAKAAIVSWDLSGVLRGIVEDAPLDRRGHRHTGPVIPSGKTRYDSLDCEMPRITKQYPEDLSGLIAESVRRANAALAPAVVKAATGREDSLTFNRRFYMKDGSIGWNPGKSNPNIIRPAGPIDPVVLVVHLATPGGKPAATYVNYALHLDTVGGLRYSSDYPYTLAKQDAAPFYDLVRAFDIKRVAERKGEPLEAVVQVLAVGDELAWACLPGEIFTELGMMIKLASPFRFTIISELTNGTVGYIPNRKAYPELTYEVLSARCGAGSGELLVDSATKQLVALHTAAHAKK